MTETLDPYALATLSDVRAELPTTLSGATDQLLTMLINEESAHFEAVTDRKILWRRYKWFTRARYGKIVPRQAPVTKIEKLAGGGAASFYLAYSGPLIRVMYRQDTTDSTGVAADIVVIQTWSAGGTETDYTFPLADYASTSACCPRSRPTCQA